MADYNDAVKGGWILLAVFTAVSCGSDDSRAVGDWVGKFAMENGKTEPGANLRLDDHHHWRELYKNLDVEGGWRLEGDTVMLKVELYDGHLVADAKKIILANAGTSKNPEALKSIADNLDKPMMLTVSRDGKSMTRTDPLAGGKAIFTRQ